MCPRCRFHGTEDTSARLHRCPEHPNTVLVSPLAVAESDGDPFIGAVVAGRFAILGLIGAGSMGTVYRARQEGIGRDVALKVVRSDRLIDAQAKARFQQEAHAMSLLTSPYTVAVYDFGEVQAVEGDPEGIDGALYLAMELLDGESVGARIKRLGRLGIGEVLTVLQHALASLQEAHEKGVVHRDLKPDNLLLCETKGGELVCKVLDFGIAKLLTSDGRVDVLETQAGTVFGTPRYMSPEQAQGKKLDARSDLYALGVIAYHMLAGRAPFTDDDAVIVMAHHIKTVPKRPTEVCPELRLPVVLEDLIMRALDKTPAGRPQTAAEFRDLLERAAGQGEDGSVETAAVSGARPSRRGRALGIVSAVIVASSLLGVLASRRVRFDDAAQGANPRVEPGPVESSTPEPPTASPSATASAIADSGESPTTAPSAASSASASPPVAPLRPATSSPRWVYPPPQKKRTYTKWSD